MKVDITTPSQFEAEKLGQLVDYYHGRLDKNVRALNIHLQYGKNGHGLELFVISIEASLLHGESVILDEVQSDLQTAGNRILNRLLRHVVRLRKTKTCRHY